MPNLQADEFKALTGVSRETQARLHDFADLLLKWQTSVKLVGSGSLDDLWRRHMLDSAQLFNLAPHHAGTWIDFGSGGGFPGLVLAIMGAADVHLVESHGRKCAFLEEIALMLNMKNLTIHHNRVEDLEPWPVDVVTSRAFAPLSHLCNLAAPFHGPGTVCLFPKGQDVEKELTAATKCWTMTVDRIPSRSDFSGTVLRLQGLSCD